MQFGTFQDSAIMYIAFEIIGCYLNKKTKTETKQNKKKKTKEKKRKGKERKGKESKDTEKEKKREQNQFYLEYF